MRTSPFRRAFAFIALAIFTSNLIAQQNVQNNNSDSNIHLSVLGTYAAGAYNLGAAEIVAHDAETQRLFVVNGATGRIDVLSIANPSVPALLFSIDLAPYGRAANSVDVHNGVVAVAVEAVIKTDNGKAVFFDTDGNFIKDVTVGALPDMITFVPGARKILVANEGEPNSDYTIDPPGTVSIIDIRHGLHKAKVTTADFAAYDDEILDGSIRIFGPNASVSKDLEPEYITVSDDSKFAYVTLQENNALGVLNLNNGRFVKLIGLGFSDHSREGFGLDSSDRLNSSTPGVIEIAPRPVVGMYQPDAIASFKHRGRTLLITANEGDAREYSALTEEARINSLSLDPAAFPDSIFLKTDPQIGRLNVTKTLGNFDGDTDYDWLFSFGTRSFSIWTTSGGQLFDSGDDIEQITALAHPMNFNASNSNNTRDDRSDNKGPEPEGVTTGKVCGRNYAFVGLERIGGVLVYELSDPRAPRFVQYINNRNFSAATNTPEALDLGPEGLHFIKRRNSPINSPLLVVANEVSGTTTVYEIDRNQCRCSHGRNDHDDDEEETE
ncbi:MAG: choice-of-anchor I family protein [Saprospiraceae bacterium]|nr:choice-of-anchor I family protein [Pyrinomonadaceae bacterium]